MAEQLIRNEQVVSSILTISSNPVNGDMLFAVFFIFIADNEISLRSACYPCCRAL